MSGTFGYELDLTKLTDEEKEIIKSQCNEYRKYYDLINQGELYRLISPWKDRTRCAWSFVSEDPLEDYKTVGFQYVSFLFDGDDILFLSRTAYNRARSFHDNNYVTFHRIHNFRKKATLATQSCVPSQHILKIACVGDSLTYGYGLTHADFYPSVLQSLLGTEKYLVKNFGAQGRTMTLGLTDKTFTDRSYYDTEIYQESLKFQADIVILCLGTNDSWKVDMTTEAGKQGYVQGLTTLVNRYRQVGVKEIYVCLPPHCINNNIGDMIEENIIPLIQENASVLNYKIIDYFTPTKGHSEYLLSDQLHFKPIGYSVMANATVQHFWNMIKNK